MKDNGEYTVKALAQLAGVSSRTLRYYDRIGLLHPARTSGSGYRLYGAAEVDRLQQILFYRELELPLAQIRAILSSPDFDRRAALGQHLAALESRRQRLDRLIETARATLAADKGGTKMTDREKFEGFKQEQLAHNEAAHGKETRQRWGDEAVDASNRRFAGLSQEEYDAMQALAEEILTRLEAAVAAGADPAGEEGRAIAQLHRQWLGYTWPSYSAPAHLGLVEMYVADERFTAYYDARRPGCAAFLRDAIAALVHG